MPSVVTMQIWFNAWNAGICRAREEYDRREAELDRFKELWEAAEIPEYCKKSGHPLSEVTISWRNGSWRCEECRNEWQREKYRRAHPIGKRAVKLKIGPKKRKELAKKYQDGALVRELAAEYRISRPTVLRTLRLAGVPIRGRHESARMAQPKGYRQLTASQRIEIIDRYLVGRESSSALALDFGVSPMTILRTLRNAGIPRRNKSESLKAAYETQRTRARERA